MKVIFLDIDGVLNSVYSKARNPSGFIGIDAPKVKNLRKIIESTGASIVLTSTWKDQWERDKEDCAPDGRYLNQKLRKEHLRILDKTRCHTSKRGKGIREWLDVHPKVDRWVVLDDDIFPDYEERGIIEHLVKTSFFNGGLTEELAQRAIEILET